MNNNDAILKTFYEESEEILSEIENLVMDLESDPANKEQMEALFRVMHTLKGSAGMVGLENIYLFTHELEDILDSVRTNELQFSSEIANLCLVSRDWLTSVLANQAVEDASLLAEKERLLGLIGKIKGKESESEQGNEPKVVDLETPSEEELDEEKTFRIHFIPGEKIFFLGVRPLLLLQELRDLGEISLKVLSDNIPLLSEMKADQSYLGWDILLTTRNRIESIKDVFIFIESESILEIDEISNDNEGRRIGEILQDRGYVTSDVLKEALQSQKRLGEVLLEKHIVNESQLSSALMEQAHLNKIKEQHQSQTLHSNIRVSTDKLDVIVNLVGELVTLQARLNQVTKESPSMELGALSEDLQRLVEDLRDSVLGIRMLPIGTTFASFRRLVRDLSKDLGKNVKLVTEGGETELDKTVIERLNDPLIHLIRNCMDHGLESPEQRKLNKKEEMGTIRLSASHSGGHVVVCVEDDGGGINRDNVFNTAVKRGLIKKDAVLSDQDVYELIFSSGFSTSKEVSRISGRGVGMDVVKKEIEKLQGTISIDSQAGKYTKINFSIPLTLAIVDGLLVRIEEDYYIVPLSSVESCLELPEDPNGSKTRDITHYRDTLLPYIRLRKFLEYTSKTPKMEQIVVVRSENMLFGLVVDQVIGDHQTVIKNMGKTFKNVRIFSGATIMGNGHIALILNPNLLGKLFIDQEKKTYSGHDNRTTIVV